MVFNIGKTLDKEFKTWKGKKMTKHTKGQRIALETFLNDYDADLPFQDILNDLCGEQAINSTIIQEYYEDWPGEKLAESINDLAQSIDRENAAPELLEALVVLHSCHRAFSNSENWTVFDDEARLLAENAINKAKGE